MMKHAIKRAIGHSIFASRLGSVLMRNMATVVAFHRVRDTARPEGLTVNVSMFERYCRFFQNHFQVVPLRELVNRLERGQKLHGALAITFDDGYRDNFEYAAPVLEKLSLPATFFVVTQWMGTDVVPWWDRTEGVQYPWMTWDQVRTLQRRGFDIGAHTRTHVDLGVVDPLVAQQEILGARQELEEQLDAPVDLFAYPYGKPTNLADSNRQVVKRAGFRCCCSCFGGLNTRKTDPLHLRRVPISPHWGPPDQFAFEIVLGRSVLAA
jgi:peptidoglycan/xylan/chitin deacetylase (PgdA/CDA1 family)